MQKNYQQLIQLRVKVRLVLSFLVLFLHAFFVGGIAFYRDWFSQPLISGGTVTVGLAAAAGVVILMVFLELVYILISAKKLDPLQEKVVAEVNNED